MAQVNLNIDELKGFVNHIIKNNRFLQEGNKNPVAVEVVGESGIGKTSAGVDICRAPAGALQISSIFFCTCFSL